MRKYIFSFFLLLFQISFSSLAQNDRNRLNVWCFGNNAGIDFNSGTPVSFAGSAITTGEGCASISNTGGQLLFYTDGVTVWDRTHLPMPNANGTSWNTSLSGDESSVQSALITTHPCDTNKYYVFTTDGITCSDTNGPMRKYDGLFYSVIDMTLNGGKGDVDIAYLATQAGYVAGSNKISLIDSVQEKINAAIHSNGIDYWVVAQRLNGGFYSFLIDCNGINITPVISPTTYTANVNQATMAISKDGKSLVAAGGSNWGTHIFDFNTTTGALSNKRILIPEVGRVGAGWGVCFSPNDSIIYVSSWSNAQYKRFERYAANVQASGVTGVLPTLTTILQLGPDGKIYATNNTNSNQLSVFNTPNNFTNPGFVSNALTLSAGTNCSFGLPNIFVGLNSMKRKEFVRSDTAFCVPGDADASINIGTAPLDCFDYLWDPITGLDDPTSSNPNATLSQTATYKVSVSSSCTTYVDSVKITISTCDESAAFFPNACTPNSDGVNDVFIPVLYDYTNTNYELQIFDRWGNLIFTTNDYKQGWNGCVGNSTKPVQQDVYVYKLFAIDKYGKELKKIGHVSVIR